MTNWISVALEQSHEGTDFDCGEPALNEWLINRATLAGERGSAKTYVWLAPTGKRVIAYYAIAPHMVRREEVPRKHSGGLSVIPAYLLARLALDRDLKGQGLGGELLHDALGRILEASEVAGGRLVVVDAMSDGAASFYRRYGFEPVKENPRRLVHKVSTLRAAFSEP